MSNTKKKINFVIVATRLAEKEVSGSLRKINKINDMMNHRV